MEEIKWCDPPTKQRGQGKENKWKKLLRPLTERPTVWACITSKANESRASALAYYLRSGKANLEGEWEFLARGNGVWARFLKARPITENTTQGEEISEVEAVVVRAVS